MRRLFLILIAAAMSIAATCDVPKSPVRKPKDKGKTGPVIVLKPRGGGGEYADALSWNVTWVNGNTSEIPPTYSVRSSATIDADLVESVRTYTAGGLTEPKIRLLAGDMKLNIERDGGNLEWTMRLPASATTRLAPVIRTTWSVPFELNYFGDGRLEVYSAGSWVKADRVTFRLYP